MRKKEQNSIISLFNYKIDKKCFKDYELSGKDNFIITKVSPSNNIQSNSLSFVKNEEELQEILRNNSLSSCLIIVRKDQFIKIKNIIALKKNMLVLADNPRLQYAIILEKILTETKYHENNLKNLKFNAERHIFMGKNVEVGINVIIEPFVFIGSNVIIGDNTIIRSGSKILNNVKIGKCCVIEENVVIGSQTLGVEKDNNQATFRIPQLGGVIIYDNVFVGSNSSIDSGTIEPTIIHNEVKIGNLVYIAHNSKIGSSTIIAPTAMVCGSVIIGNNVWLGPNTTISNKIKIGNSARVNIGAIVTKDVPENKSVTGNFAIEHKQFILNLKKIISET